MSGVLPADWFSAVNLRAGVSRDWGVSFELIASWHGGYSSGADCFANDTRKPA